MHHGLSLQLTGDYDSTSMTFDKISAKAESRH